MATDTDTDAGTGTDTGTESRTEPRHRDVHRGDETTRISRAWVTTFVALVLLLIAVVFIAQNGDDVVVEFLAWEGTISLGLALLVATIVGGLAVFLLGAARMTQLRRRQRRQPDEPVADRDGKTGEEAS